MTTQFVVETLAAVLTLGCVWLTSKRMILSWPVGIAAIVLYAMVFFDFKLYADFGLQFIFLAQSLYGWHNWTNNRVSKTRTSVTRLSSLNRVISVGAILLMYVIIAYVLIHHTDASVPYVDSYLTATCIVANFLLSRRAIENWILWIHADVLYVGLFAYKGLYVSSALYLILAVLAVRGLMEWNDKMKVNEGS